MMRKTFSIIFIILLGITLTGCGGGKLSGKQAYGEAVYTVMIQDDVEPGDMVNMVVKNANQYFKRAHPNLVYTEFFYGGNLDSLDRVNGEMQITYLGTDTSSLINSPKKLVAEYTKTNRNLDYFVQDTSEKTDATTTVISSLRFSQVAEKVQAYFGNLGISSGYVEMTEYALEGYWTVYHYALQGKNADTELKIDSVTLELIEYNQNP
jgi:uncharacterized membrane protein YkoI